jgi:protein TilB
MIPSPQDGQAIKPSERIAAAQALAELEVALLGELRAEGVDVEAAGAVEDDSLYDESGAAVAEVPETGYVDEKGELVRPWCPATRILEHREMVGAWLRKRVGGGGEVMAEGGACRRMDG